MSKNRNKSFFAGKKANCEKKKRLSKRFCHGNVNVDEHVTITLKNSQIIYKEMSPSLVVIHVA